MSRCSECGRKDCCGSWMEEDHYKQTKNLERQLEEAREALNSIRGILPTVHSSDREIHEIINKVLKEQG